MASPIELGSGDNNTSLPDVDSLFDHPDYAQALISSGRLPNIEIIVAAVQEINRQREIYGQKASKLSPYSQFDHSAPSTPEGYGYHLLQIEDFSGGKFEKLYYYLILTEAAQARKEMLQGAKRIAANFPIPANCISKVREAVQFLYPQVPDFRDLEWHKKRPNSAESLYAALTILKEIGFLTPNDLTDIQLFISRLQGLAKEVNDWFGQEKFVSQQDLEDALHKIFPSAQEQLL